MACRLFGTNSGVLSIRPLGTNFNDILIEIEAFSFQENAFEKDVCKMSNILSRPQCFNTSMPKYK